MVQAVEEEEEKEEMELVVFLREEVLSWEHHRLRV